MGYCSWLWRPASALRWHDDGHHEPPTYSPCACTSYSCKLSQEALQIRNYLPGIAISEARGFLIEKVLAINEKVLVINISL